MSKRNKELNMELETRNQFQYIKKIMHVHEKKKFIMNQSDRRTF